MHFARRSPTRPVPRFFFVDGLTDDKNLFDDHLSVGGRSRDDESKCCTADEDEAEAADIKILNMSAGKVDDEHVALVAQVDPEMAEAGGPSRDTPKAT